MSLILPTDCQECGGKRGHRPNCPQLAVSWDTVFRAGAPQKALRCANCGRETFDALDVVAEMCLFDAGPRQRKRHQCAHCGTPMPWCDERNYGVGVRAGGTEP